MWKCYKEFHMLQLQGFRGEDAYAYEKRYVNSSIRIILLSISNGDIISFMINVLSHFHCRIGILDSKWLWLCSCCLGDEMVPYMHVQGAHALDMTWSIHPYTLGRLMNEVMEHKHREMKILNCNQGGGRGVAKENRGTFELDRICLVNEMKGKFFKLVIRSEGTFQIFRQRKHLPSNVRNQLRVEYEKSRNPLNEETATKLASCFPGVTSQQVKQLFDSWVKQSK